MTVTYTAELTVCFYMRSVIRYFPLLSLRDELFVSRNHEKDGLI